jgi:TolB-like protein/Tfp pilus assembly protein PilF
LTDTPAERAAESTWTSLRRRKVVQWGIAYVAAAWGLLQGLAYATATFHWPEQVQQLTTLGLVIGLPVVLVVAYYHGDRGQQRVTTPEFAILTLLLLLGGGAFSYYQRTSDAGTDSATTASTAQPATSPGTKDARPSVAVLPFENRSDESKDAYFVDGMHDDILTQLSKVSALRVISRTSVEQFRGTKLPVKAIADQLGVTKILEGGVQRAGDRVRIHVQLIDAGSDAHVWAESYDRELNAANIFAIQSEVAAAIAGALKASLTASEQVRIEAIPTQSLEAWQAYQLGRQRLSRRTSAALIEAEGFFRKTVAIDPKFALAWVGLANTLTLQPQYSGRPQDAAFADAEQAVTRALELDPNLAEAWASAGLLANNRLQDERAEQMLRRAIALNPNYAPAHHWLSTPFLTDRHEALAAAERAVALDPLSAIINNNLGAVRMNVGRFDDALVAFRQAIEIDPTMPTPYGSIGEVHASGFGRFDTAVTWYEKAASLDPGNPQMLASLASAYWMLGDDAEAGRWLDRIQANGGETTSTNAIAALLYLDRGDRESARKYAQRAAELDRWNMALIRDDDLRKGDYPTARARYAKAFPELLAKELPKVPHSAPWVAVELALVLQHTGEGEHATALLDHSEAHFRTIPRMGWAGYRINDVAIHALRGDTAKALAKLREAEQAGWRSDWRYHRDFDPALASIRNEPEFKAVFADIERDMARQRARLAARPKDAPLELTEASR